MDKDNSRRRDRVSFETSLSISNKGERIEFQRTYDLSMNGAFVKTVKPLPLGSTFPFTMTLSFGMNKKIIQGKCEVVRVVEIDDGLSSADRGAGMGLKFIELEPESSEILYNVVRYNQPAD